MITLTTDFGDAAYIGAMRGAILSVAPESKLVDITHTLPPHDIPAGAYAMFSAVPYYPEGTVHLGVVDPGVGTERRGIAIQAGGQYLVGPDNGLLLPAARRLGIQQIVELAESKYWRQEISRTFHGRDIFGPVAGHLDQGVDIEDLGPPMDLADLEDLDFGEPIIEEGVWTCEVINIDPFGNVTTNMPGSMVLDEVDFGATAVIESGAERLKAGLYETYGQAAGGHPFVTIGSAGLAELALREASFADTYRVQVGDEIQLQFLPRQDPMEEMVSEEE